MSWCSVTKEMSFLWSWYYSRTLSFRLARHRKIVEPEVVGESDSEVEGDPWRMEREDSSEEEEEEIDEEVWLRKVGSSFWVEEEIRASAPLLRP